MKKLNPKISLLIIAFLTVAVTANAQVKADEHNLITKLISLDSRTPAEVNGYFLSKGFKPGRENRAPTAKTQLSVKIYKVANSTDHYFINQINGKIFTVGYNTYAQSVYQYAIKVINGMGFKVVNKRPSAANTVYAKPNTPDRIIVLIRQDKKGICYTIQVNNMIKGAKMDLPF